MKKFEKRVNENSREEMIAFLQNHFRYDTASSWNRLTSYANDVKIHHMCLTRDDLTEEEESRLYQMLDFDEFWAEVNEPLEEFAWYFDYTWNIRPNGRSSGYLVLYSGSQKQSEYKSYCTFCGQKNFKAATPGDCRCGVCHKDTRVNFKIPPMEIRLSSASVDQDEDFEDWTMEELQERVKLVCMFDRACDEMAERAVWFAKAHKVGTETVLVQQERKVLKAV